MGTGTAVYECGCAVSTLMFKPWGYVHVIPCYRHSLEMQPEMKIMADKIGELIDNDKISSKHEETN